MPAEKVLVLEVGSTVRNRSGVPSLLPAPCERQPREVVDLVVDVSVGLETRKSDGTRRGLCYGAPGMEWGAWVCACARAHVRVRPAAHLSGPSVLTSLTEWVSIRSREPSHARHRRTLRDRNRRLIVFYRFDSARSSQGFIVRATI